MKKQIITLVLLITVALTQTNFANPQEKITKDHPNYDQIEDNLLVGINSENFGLRVSSAYMLGELQSERAVNSLTKMLREETHEGAKLMAALSLIKIGTERSIYVVKSSVKFNDSERVRKMCEHLYTAYISKTHNLQNTDTKLLLSFFENN
ncbi:MAG: HEAT repeat domain-containing protein [Melioribacteraceae bacterium]|nr:HEAT repeat domain-containing protein [Melioribacteraceae bacterium]